MENLECHLICSRCECDTKKFASDCPISCYTILKLCNSQGDKPHCPNNYLNQIIVEPHCPNNYLNQIIVETHFPNNYLHQIIVETHSPNNYLNPGLGIRSFAHRSFAHSLICSFRSNQMIDCECFAQIAQDK